MSSYSATTRVVFELQPEAQPHAAAPPLSETFEQLAEVGKQACKAMVLRIFDCIDPVVNQATKAMLLSIPPLQPVLPASLIDFPVLPPELRLPPNSAWAGVAVLAPPPIRKPPPRPPGRPLGSSRVSFELIVEKFDCLSRELKRPPTMLEVADALDVTPKTVSRHLRRHDRQWPPHPYN